MRNIYLFGLFLLFFPVVAQDQNSKNETNYASMVRDDFNENQVNWPLVGTSFNMTFEAGVAKLQHTATKPLYLLQEFNLGQERDFSIEFRFDLSQGEVGFCWGVADEKNMETFSIKSTGEFRVIQLAKGAGKAHKISKSPAIKQGYNELKLALSGTLLQYFINGVKVFEKQRYEQLSGYKIGLAVWGQTSVSFDYFEVSQDHKGIKIDDKNIFSAFPIRLSKNINTVHSELSPMISADGKTLYYCARDYPSNLGGKGIDDIYFSEMDEKGQWGPGKTIGKPLNNEQPNTVSSISHDGHKLLLVNIYHPDGHSTGNGVSMSHKTDHGWAYPIGQKLDKFHNKSDFSEYCLANDNVMIMSLKEKETYGENDLYVSFKKTADHWSEPLNMGKVLNTVKNDFSPFMAADGITLYFSSEGLPGYGSADVFVSKRLDSTWTNWSEPINLGPALNGVDFDAFYTLPASGTKAYYVRTNEGTREDIYSIELPTQIRPEAVGMIQGKVYNAKNKQAIDALILVADSESNEMIADVNADMKSGYKTILQKGRKYTFIAQAEGYIAVSESVDLKEIKTYQEFRRDLYLVPIEVGQAVALNNVFFHQSMAELLPESFHELDRLVKVMRDNPNIEIELLGHTDNQGDPELNRQLSEKRVLSVKKYIESKGILAFRVTGKGLGSTQPIAPNDTEDNRKKNRRVEFKITKK